MSAAAPRPARALAERLAQHLGGPSASPDAIVDGIDAWLGTALEVARARWPDVRLDDEAFVEHVRRRLEPGDGLAPLEQLHADDLFLACACGHGDGRAIEALSREHRPMLAKVFATPSASGIDGEDLQQILLERLLIGEPPRPPKILDYTGRGRLRTWIKVTATRLRIDSERRRGDKADSLEDRSLQRIEQAVSADMEVVLLQQRYRAAFKEAFQQALRSLEPEQRNLLRLTIAEGLSATDIARLHGVHRATAKRWLVQVRAQLLHDTERRLAERLGVGETELHSVLGLLRSQLEISMRRHLEEP